MKVQVKGVNKSTQEIEYYTLEVADTIQAHRYCKTGLNLEKVKTRQVDNDSLVDISFTELQQYLSVHQYRKIRRARGSSQFPVLELHA